MKSMRDVWMVSAVGVAFLAGRSTLSTRRAREQPSATQPHPMN
jgi:hypothetical protein